MKNVKSKSRKRDVPAEAKVFAFNFRTMRRASGLSVEDISQRTGIAVAYITQVELGHINATLRTLSALATAIKMPVYKLLSPPREE